MKVVEGHLIIFVSFYPFVLFVQRPSESFPKPIFTNMIWSIARRHVESSLDFSYSSLP